MRFLPLTTRYVGWLLERIPLPFHFFLVVCQAAAIDVAMDRPGASGLATGVCVGPLMSIQMDIMRGKRASRKGTEKGKKGTTN